MSQTTEELKSEIQRGMDLMQVLRDEIRIKVHLAGMDAKEEWRRLEPRVADLERAAGELTEATHKAIAEAVAKLRKLRASLN